MINLIVGMGKIGKPLMEILSTKFRVFGRDEYIDCVPMNDVDILHICFPYDDHFVIAVSEYIETYQPTLTIIHSTVVPGTTDKLGAGIVYSPVRGRHGEMIADLKRYAKFVAGDEAGVRLAKKMFEVVGLTVRVFPSARALELAKLIETTYSGLLIAWAQEMERYGKVLGVDYFDLMPFLAEINHLPPVAFQPGHIGGHCIIPNLDLLSQVKESLILSFIMGSNIQKKPSTERLYPIPMEDFRCPT